MSLFKKIEQIKAQIVDTEQMLSLVGNHPLMANSLTEKLEDLRQELESIPEGIVESKVHLLFSGQAVRGGVAIQ